MHIGIPLVSDDLAAGEAANGNNHGGEMSEELRGKKWTMNERVGMLQMNQRIGMLQSRNNKFIP